MGENKKSILYVQTSDEPERQYSPLVLAQTAKAMDLDAKVFYFWDRNVEPFQWHLKNLHSVFKDVELHEERQ